MQRKSEKSSKCVEKLLTEYKKFGNICTKTKQFKYSPVGNRVAHG